MIIEFTVSQSSVPPAAPALCGFAARMLVDCHTVTLEPPSGTKVPRRLERSLAVAREALAKDPENAGAASKLLNKMTRWLRAPLKLKFVIRPTRPGEPGLFVQHLTISSADVQN